MKKNNQYSKISPLKLPKVIFGTSVLGNLFVSMDEEKKFRIIKECIDNSPKRPVFDSAGKYGAGMALEILGRSLEKLNIKREDVIISNKLGWLRTELRTKEPTFESGVWKNLEYDAVQKISYDGIIECFEQGNEFLKGYIPKMVSVHDPDEYLSRAQNERQEQEFYEDILDAYRALYDLKGKKKIEAIGVGAKDWNIIKRIANDVPLDWVMIANSMTIKSHPEELLDFIQQLKKKGTLIINAAVFHSGFLVGGPHYDYKLVTAGTQFNDSLLRWREDFFEVCKYFNVKPSEASVQFAINVPGIDSIALSASSMKEVKENLAIIYSKIPAEFWKTLIKRGLISEYLHNHMKSLTSSPI